MKIPYVDIARQHAGLKEKLLHAVGSVIDRGMFIFGDEVCEFERRFAELCGVRYAVGVNSGTDALVLALKALGIGPGDEVITTPNAFVACVSCITLVGAQPVFVDVLDDYNIDPEQVEAAITSKTRGIIVVHLTGRPANMDSIIKVAASRNLFVIEDCAQAVCAQYHGQSVGSFGIVGCFSLHPLKTLNACGDGGVLTTNDAGLYDEVKLLRNLGLRTRDDCVRWAGNSRLDTIQAAMLLVKLDHLEAWTEARRRNAIAYQQGLADVKQVRTPSDKPHEYAVYHTFVIGAEERDRLQAFLAAKGIGTAIHYPVPLHLHHAARSLGYGAGSFPVAEAQSSRILSLPVHQDLRKEELDYVIACIHEAYQGDDVA